MTEKKDRIKIDRNGQVQLPQKAMDYLGLKTGDLVKFIEEEDGSYSIKKAREG